MAVPILAIIGFFSCLFIFIIMYFNSRNRERMALIEAGFNPNADKMFRRKNLNLKLGIFTMALGIGLILGIFVDSTILNNFEPAGTFGMMLISGGAAFLYYHSKLDELDAKSSVTQKKNYFNVEEDEEDLV